MISTNAADGPSKEHCKYEVTCEKAVTDYCVDHSLEHQDTFREDIECILQEQDLLYQKLKSLITQLSADVILDLIKEIHEFKIQSDNIEKIANVIQQQIQVHINDDAQDLKKQLITMTNKLHVCLKNDIERLRQEIEQLKLKFEKINNYSQNRISHEQLYNAQMNLQSDNSIEILNSPPSNLTSLNKYSYLLSAVCTSRNSAIQQAEAITTLSQLLLKQMSPSILDLSGNELALSEVEYEECIDDKDKLIEISSSNTTPRINQKIHLSNNIVRWLRGPFRIMVDGTLHMVDLCAQGTHISDAVMQAVKEGFARQNQITSEQQTIDHSLKPPFAEMTSDWIFEGVNSDRGYSSESIWMTDPQRRRILVKTQDHALCAVNEWLAYALGTLLHLPVNEVQIAIYQNNLVTLHTDVAHEHEKTITFMDLPKKIRKTLLKDPAIACMDLFDHIIQNVDRNQRNILITIPKTSSIDDENAKLKVHLIDHSLCFGMGKLNGISLVANKFHSQHLSIVKFDPIGKAKKFEQYLSKLPIADRVLIRKTLNRFAAVTNDHIDQWITEVQTLLSPSQYNRIHCVLYRQRDIARRYTTQWGLQSKSPSAKPNGTNDLKCEVNNNETYF